MFLYVDVFQLMNKEGMIELEYHYFAISNETMDQSNGC